MKKSSITKSFANIFSLLVFTVYFVGLFTNSAQAQIVAEEQAVKYTFAGLFADPAQRPALTGLAVRGLDFYVGADDRNVYRFNIENQSSELFVRGGNAWIRSVAVSPDQSRIATLSQDGTLSLWDPGSKTRITATKEAVSGAHDIAYSHDGSVIAICGYDQTIAVVDANSLNRVQTLSAPSQSSTTIEFSVDDRKIAVGSRSGVRVFDRSSGTYMDLKKNVPSNLHQMRRVRAVAFSPDSRLIAVGGDFDNIFVFKSDTGEFVTLLALPQFSDSADVNSSEPKLASKLDTGYGKVYSLTFGGDSNTLISGDSLNRVIRWDISNGKSEIKEGHTGTVSSLVFIPQSQSYPQGPFVLSSSFDATVIKWKL